MQNNSSDDVVSNSAMASVISALGTLIGYLGAEAATVDFFERLLWPQRFYTGITVKSALLIGLGMPMGGPLHQAALHTLDKLYRSGLLKGPRLGNMLGTAFFYDSGLVCDLHDQSHRQERAHVRNGLWVRTISKISMPVISQKGAHVEHGSVVRTPVRAKTSVNLLQLSFAQGVAESKKTIRNDTGPISSRCLMSVIWSEITGLALRL